MLGDGWEDAVSNGRPGSGMSSLSPPDWELVIRSNAAPDAVPYVGVSHLLSEIIRRKFRFQRLT